MNTADFPFHARVTSPPRLTAAWFLLVGALLCGVFPHRARAQTVDSFAATGSLATPRQGHTATRLADARVLVAGGFTVGGALAGAEIFDETTGRWMVTGSLTTARSGHTAALLPNGNVLIAGGRDAAGAALAGAELFDPATGTWTATGAMSTPRLHHAATVMGSGLVMVSGGMEAEAAAEALGSSETYNPSSGLWTETGFLNAPRAFHTSSRLGDEVVLLGGVSGSSYVHVLEFYNPTRPEWSVIGSGAGTPDRLRKSHTATVLPDFRVLVAGGRKAAPLATTAIYKSFGWTASGAMSTARTDHTATLLLDGRVLAAGGEGAAGTALAGSELYGGSQWSPGVSLAQARSGHTATELSGGRVLITGGRAATGALASCEIFTPKRSAWMEMRPMQNGRMSHRATLLPSGKLLVTGGEGWHTIVASAELYDPSTDVWTPAGDFGARAGHTATLLPDGRVMVSGGYRSIFDSTVTASTDIYDPATNTWSAAGNMQARRSSHAAALLPDGRVLAAGGYDTVDGNQTAVTAVEIFDPSTGSWSPTASMATPRARPSATLLTNGRVLVISGNGDYDERPGSAELYDPVSGTWSPAGPMLLPHFSFTTTLLRDGRVLVAGPYTQSGTPGTSEVYDPVSNTWDSPATLPTDHYNLTAILLPDGRVLLTGSDSGSPRGAFYDPETNVWSAFNVLNSFGHGTTLMPDGRIFFTGGQIMGSDPASPRTRMYDPYLPAAAQPRPVIVSAWFDEAQRIVLAGTGFAGNPDGAPPVVTLRRLDNGQTVTLVPDTSADWSGTAFKSAPLTGFPQGHAMVTVMVNGVAGISTIVSPLDPEITLERADGVDLADGGEVHFGSLAPGTHADLTFTVRNRGRSELNGLALTVTGPDAPRFTITATPAPSLTGPGGNTAFTVRFAPGGAGPHSAGLRLASNDADENPFDLVLTGIGSDSAPVISPVADQVVDEDGAVGPLAFSVNDLETPAAQLTVTAVSSNPSLTPAAALVLGGGGADRTITVTPQPGASGTAVITLTVSDGVFQTGTTFQLTVNAVNDSPTLAEIPNPPVQGENAPEQTIALQGMDSGEGAAQPVTVTAVSDRPELFRLLTVTNGTLRYQTAPDTSGKAQVTVTVDDGQGAENSRISRAFTVTVLPTLHGESARVTEGNAGTAALAFRLFIHSPQTEAVSVGYQTESTVGGAQPGTDFLAASGTAVIPAGATETVVDLGIVGDTLFEQDESLALALSEPSGAFLSTGGESLRLDGLILNDDAQPTLAVTAGSVTESPRGGPFQVWISATLSAPSAEPLSWTVQTRGGTAEAGVDFTPLGPAALTFAAGETSKWVAVRVGATESGPGAGAEGDEIFHLDFTPASGPGAPVTSLCTIRQLVVQEFFPLGIGLYAVRFPTGRGQSYVIEESDSPGGPWTDNSAIILGTGNPVIQVVFSSKTKAFFRVSAAPAAPGTAAVGP